MMISVFLILCVILRSIVAIPMHENDAVIFKRIVEMWELAGTEYDKALDDCPTSNANVQCFGASTLNAAKRQRIRYFRAVGNKHLNQKSIPTVIFESLF